MSQDQEETRPEGTKWQLSLKGSKTRQGFAKCLCDSWQTLRGEKCLLYNAKQKKEHKMVFML